MSLSTVPVPTSRVPVPRARLLRRLTSVRDIPLVLLVAPAGYGKTTLISEWAACDGRSFEFVTLTAADNEAPYPQLRAAIAQHDPGAVLVFDDVQVLTAGEPLSLLAELIGHQPFGGQIVLSSRTEPAVGVGGLRARRKLVELRAADLAMTTSEADLLLRTYGFELERAALEALVHRTEGWPAALYLAVLAGRDDGHGAHAIASFGGDDRFVADYVDDELLSPLAPDKRDFLAALSVLDRLSGPVCDFVLERTGSARLLKRLSRTGVMLIPLDRGDAEYRLHRLFAQTLQGELRRSEPGREATLHLRASAWYEQQGDPERAIEHAIAGGDLRLTGDLMWPYASRALGYGHVARLNGWLARFSDGQIASCATLSLVAAAVQLAQGDRPLAEHWAAAGERRADDARSAEDRRALGAHAVLLRAAVAEDLVARTGKRAELAARSIPDASGWRPLGNLLRGMAQHMRGHRERARELLEEGARLAAAESPWVQSLCLAQLALIALESNDWVVAECLAARAKAQIERSGVAEYPTVALVYAVVADVQAQRGQIEASKAASRTARRLLAALTDFSPWYEAECRIALARAALRLSDVLQARTLLADAGRQLERARDADAARGWLEWCEQQAAQSPASSAADEWCLTTAELRVLQFLPTHVSMREIADLLYVSRNTVKTHARSVYRKLGASSRGDAVVRARQAGLLDEAAHVGAGAT